MRERNRRGVRASASALVTLALIGAGPVSGEERHGVVTHVRGGHHHFGFGLAIGGPYVGAWGYGGLYPGLGGYGSGLYLGLGGHSGGVIVGVGGHGGMPYPYPVPGVYTGGVAAAPLSSGYPYYGMAPVPPAAVPGDALQPAAPRVVVPGAARTGDALVIETVRDDILRLTWRDDAARVREVTLFLADERRQALAQQTLSTGPFTALFDRAPGTAYAGVTVRYPDGVETTTLMPVPGR
jgi:hypothetical protein